MNTKTNVEGEEAVTKLSAMVGEINICFFCTNIEKNEESSCRPMTVQDVDNEGNLWFFSDVHSVKNEEIMKHNEVQLYFAHPGKSAYLIVKGTVEIINNYDKTDELWSSWAEPWFKDGKEDPNVSILKVKPQSAYYWDIGGNRMVNFLKTIVSIATATGPEEGNQGNIWV